MSHREEAVVTRRRPQNNVRERQVGEQLAFAGDLVKPQGVFFTQAGPSENGITSGDHPFSVMGVLGPRKP